MKGKLNRWYDQKGFGFIRPTDGGRDVFVHMSALKKMARRPMVGDVITFEVYLDNKGKQRAVNANIEGVASTRATLQKPGKKTVAKKYGVFGKAMVLVLVLGGGAAIYSALDDIWVSTSGSGHSLPLSSKGSEVSGNFSCRGKMHCSEMTSCDEAQFYLNNCPGTKMDGDGDGIPCEKQWCGR